jgi:hypothetical protein
MSNPIIKKFIDNYNDFKHTGKLSFEQMVFSIENFAKISYGIEEVVKVINNKSFCEYNEYNLINYLNCVYNEQTYDVFMKEHKKKICYWIINTEFYKIFNLYRILIMKTNLMMPTNTINHIIVKDFERTVNGYISESIISMRKTFEFLRTNNFNDELDLCINSFKKLLGMDDFAKSIYKRVFPNANLEEEANSDYLEQENDDSEYNDSDDTDNEDAIGFSDLDENQKNELIKSIVKEAILQAGIGLNNNTTYTIEQTTNKSTNSNNSSKNNAFDMFNNFKGVESNNTVSNVENTKTEKKTKPKSKKLSLNEEGEKFINELKMENSKTQTENSSVKKNDTKPKRNYKKKDTEETKDKKVVVDKTELSEKKAKKTK